MGATAHLQAKLTMDDTIFGRVIRSAQTRAVAFGKQLGGALMGAAKWGAIAAASLAGLAGMKGLQNGIIGAANMEREKAALEVLTGDIGTANKLLKDTLKFAADTPFEFPELAEGVKMLIAYGYSAEQAVPQLKRMGDVASGLGLPIKDLAYLFGTTRTQGRMFARDLLQFTTRGIPMIEALAAVMKVNKEDIEKLVTAGKVGFPEVQRALYFLTEEGGKFHLMMQKQSRTTLGLWSTLRDGINAALRAFAVPVLDRLRPMMSALIAMMPQFEAAATAAGNKFGDVIDAITGAMIQPAAAFEYWMNQSLANVVGGMADGFEAASAVIEYIGANWKNVVNSAGDFAAAMFNSALFQAAMSSLSSMASAFTALVRGGFLSGVRLLYDGVISAVALFPAAMITGINTVLNYFSQGWSKAVWEPIKTLASALWDMAVSFGETIMAAVKSMWTGGGATWDAAKAKAGAAVDRIGAAEGAGRITLGGNTDFAKEFQDQKNAIKAGLGGVDSWFNEVGKAGEDEIKKAGESFTAGIAQMGVAGNIVKEGAKAVVSEFKAGGGLRGMAGRFQGRADETWNNMKGTGAAKFAEMMGPTKAEAAQQKWGKLSTFANFGEGSLTSGSIQGAQGGLASPFSKGGLMGGAYGKVRRGDAARNKAEKEAASKDKEGLEKSIDIQTQTLNVVKKAWQ